ncbi:MAG: hypothetical protein ACRDOK_04515 [Streptosporangiaceae bacterium]
MPEPFKLTRREQYEQQVRDARLMRAAGLTREQIADRMCLSPRTIHGYLQAGALTTAPERWKRYAERKKAAKLALTAKGEDHGPEDT